MGKLKEMRKEKGLTQSKLSLKSGVDRSQISDIESNRVKPRMDTLERLAAALGCEPRDLM